MQYKQSCEERIKLTKLLYQYLKKYRTRKHEYTFLPVAGFIKSHVTQSCFKFDLEAVKMTF
jgi:hypothetical protein